VGAGGSHTGKLIHNILHGLRKVGGHQVLQEGKGREEGVKLHE
jgi:hypothetical protein